MSFFRSRLWAALAFPALLAGCANGVLVAAVDKSDSWKLWTTGGSLWGANVYQELNAPSQRHSAVWAPDLTRRDFERLSAAGANLVVLSVPGPAPVRENDELERMAWERLDKIVGWAAEENLWTVIALRTGPGRSEADINPDVAEPWEAVDRSLFDEGHAQKRFVRMWKRIARTYGRKRRVIGYDLLVEPHAEVSEDHACDVPPDESARFRETWLSLARRVILAIRSVDDETPILIEPPGFAAAEELDAWSPPFDSADPASRRLVMSVHQYEPSDYTQPDDRIPGAAADLGKLAAAFESISLWTKNHPGVPVAVTEFGVSSFATDAGRFLAREYQTLASHQLNHAVWIWEVADCSYEEREFDVSRGVLQSVVENAWRERGHQPQVVHQVECSKP